MFGAKKRQNEIIRKSFGKNPLEGFSFYNAEKRLDRIKRLHENLSDSDDDKWVVDEVTWNDLEMDQVFLRINHSNCFLGEQTLYHRLHKLNEEQNQEQKKEFEKRLSYYEDNPEKREEIEARLQYIGKLDEGYYLPEFLINSELWGIGNTLVFHILQILLVILFVAGFVFENVICTVGCIAVALINLGIYLYSKQKYEVFFTSLIEFKKIFDFVKWVNKADSDKRIISDKVSNAVTRLGKMSWVISGMNGRRQAAMTGDVLAIFREYLWGVLLIDVAMFNHIMKIIADKQTEVLTLLDFVGEMDSDIAILSYRSSVEQWCRPEFEISEIDEAVRTHGIKVTDIAHPLINHPVTNDFELKDRAVITGSNASGKSTFMKSIAINCILAQTINTCIAKSFNLQPMIVITCMALRDDILTGESYYYREAKCLKRMLDLVDTETRVLVVVDEILKGTNTAERIAASKAILEYLGRRKCMTIVATHDNELTDSSLYDNYHFCNKIENDDIVFDYLIHEGKSTQSNAIALLAHLGYPDEVVMAAKKNMGNK